MKTWQENLFRVVVVLIAVTLVLACYHREDRGGNTSVGSSSSTSSTSGTSTSGTSTSGTSTGGTSTGGTSTGGTSTSGTSTSGTSTGGTSTSGTSTSGTSTSGTSTTSSSSTTTTSSSSTSTTSTTSTSTSTSTSSSGSSSGCTVDPPDSALGQEFDVDTSGYGTVHCIVVTNLIWDVNCHRYMRVTVNQHIGWTDCRDIAVAMGGYLVTITDQTEQDYVRAWINGYGGALPRAIGLEQQWDQPYPDVGWEWVSGEPFSFESWEGTFEPSDGGGGGGTPGFEDNDENYGEMFSEDHPISTAQGQWNDANNYNPPYTFVAFLVEIE